MAFYVIGVGPGDSELMTVKAVRLIEEADAIIVPVKKPGAKEGTALSIAQPFIKDMSIVHYMYFPMKLGFEKDPETLALFKKHGDTINAMVDAGQTVVFLTLGDPSIYCTYTHVDKYINDVNYVPGIPSFINGAALAKQSLVINDESLCVLNMTDTEESLTKKFENNDSIVVMKVCTNQALLKKLIISGKRRATFMSNIGLDNEHITDDLSVLDTKMPYFTIALIR